jgi:iron complex outermembrane recepter protein
MHSCISRTAPAGVRSMFLALLIFFLGAAPALAQSGTVTVSVSDREGRPLANAAVRIDGTRLGTFTSAAGRATVSDVPVGDRSIITSLLGYEDQRSIVTIVAGGTVNADIVLVAAPLQVTGIDVSVLRPDLSPDIRVAESELREENPHDVGAVMRSLPGLDAIRRGGLGLDPVVRGLRDTQVGAYVDGMRTLPEDPAAWIRPSPTWTRLPSRGWR